MSAAALQFDSVKHVYRLSGRVIPGVTRCLDVAGVADYSAIRGDILERKAELGRIVHQATCFYDQGGVDLDSIPPEAHGYFNAWTKFIKSAAFVIDKEQIEQPRAGQLNGMFYGMRADRIGFMRGKRAIVDIKTTAAVHPWHGVQLAGYAAGIPIQPRGSEFFNWERYIVQLKRDGKFRLYSFIDLNDYHIFQAALAITHWRMGNGHKIRPIDEGE